MAKLLGEHWPHLIFVVLGVIAFLWTAYRPEPADVRSLAPEQSQATAPAPANVRSSVARRGLLALGPLLGASATGAVLYGLDVDGSSAPGAVIWVHSGISMLALLLVVYKVADLGLARIRRAFTRQRMPELISIILGMLSVPLLVTGVGLLVAPSTRSFIAYSHLISSAWWTGLMLWHLRRYLGPSLRAVIRPSGSQRSAAGGRLAPVELPRDRH
jgi:hypothetical protein